MKSLLSEIAKSEGEYTQAQVFAHQTMGLLTTPWSDEGRRNLDERSQFSLWMALTLVKYVWGTIDFEPAQHVYEGLDADFKEWEYENKDQILDTLLRFAFYDGLQRSARTPERTYNHEVDKIIFEAPKRAIRLINEREWFTNMNACLRTKIEGDIPSYVTWKGFVLAFHHVVRQAVHHAFLAYIDDALKQKEESSLSAYLWMKWDQDHFLVYNRASSILTKYNEEKNINNNLSRDKKYFEALMEKSKGILKILGPDETGNGVWKTAIEIGE